MRLRTGAGSSYLVRSEEHTSELQSHSDLVCRLLLEKKKTSQSPPADDPDPTPSPRPGQAQAPSGLYTRAERSHRQQCSVSNSTAPAGTGTIICARS